MKKVLRKYREIAKKIDKDIRVKKGFDNWLCWVEDKIIEVARIETERGEKAFRKSVIKRLPKEHKDLINIISNEMWSFLHEVGHIEKGRRYWDTPQRTIAEFLCRHNLDLLGDLIYFNMKEERKATEWAVRFAIENTDFCLQYTYELCRAYKNYYQSMGLGKC